MGPKPSTFHAESAGTSYVWMGLIVSENTFLEVGPIGILYWFRLDMAKSMTIKRSFFSRGPTMWATAVHTDIAGKGFGSTFRFFAFSVASAFRWSPIHTDCYIKKGPFLLYIRSFSEWWVSQLRCESSYRSIQWIIFALTTEIVSSERQDSSRMKAFQFPKSSMVLNAKWW